MKIIKYTQSFLSRSILLGGVTMVPVMAILLVTMGVFPNAGRAELTAAESQKLLASDGATFDEFGLSVSVSGDTALIGARWHDDNGVDSGSAYVFTRDATGIWTQQAKFLASDGAEDDIFGWSVSVSGDTFLIGAANDNDNGVDSGSAYIFRVIINGPVELINDLILQVLALNLQNGISNSLDAKLNNVLNALDDVNENNDVAAVNSLYAFINAVEAQSEVNLTIEEADALIELALQLIDCL